MNIAGWDSIDMDPCAADPAETSTIDSEYSGWRETTGAEWQHVYSARAFGVMNASDSEQIEHIHQQDQILNPLHISRAKSCSANGVAPVPVYMEDSNNAFSTAGYRYEFASSRITLTTGSGFWLERPEIAVEQPVGGMSPYSASSVWTDVAAFSSDSSTGESGTYAQALLRPFSRLAIGTGLRFQTFAYDSHSTLTPRLSLRLSLADSLSIHASYASYAQLPPFAYLFSYPGNRFLSPMTASHKVVGMDFAAIAGTEIRAEAYIKDYGRVPASTEYAPITMHTLIDMLGEQIVWLPMSSAGSGVASGIELSDRSKIGSRLEVQGSVAYSRAKFAGTDSILRPSNYDLPWVVNAAGIERLGRGWSGSARYGYATGRPYTPFDLAPSLKQNRPIYDLTRVNALREPYYGRLDAQVNKETSIHKQYLEIYCGVDNVLNRANILTYAWEPRRGRANSVGTLYQMPIFPNFGVRFIVR